MNEERFGFCIGRQIHRSNSSTVYEARRKRDGLPAILKVLEHGKADGPRGLASLRHEDRILTELALDCIPRSLGLKQDERGWALAMERLPGSSLRKLIDNHVAEETVIGIPEALKLSVALTTAIDALHSHRAIHKDINPDNVIVDPKTSVLWIVDFDIATRLPQQVAGFQSPTIMEGSLPYISPEQTGRTNRPVDYRTDYYSLGVSLFELLTNQRPFQFQGPLELVHAHLAHASPSIRAIREDVPIALERVVHKLMAKSADDRYQSATGICSDLQAIARALEDKREVELDALGTADVSRRFVLPSKLYARQSSVAQLENCFSAAQTVGAQTVLVSGPSGIGKSAVVRELYRPITKAGSLFAAGKFEQYGGSRPYGAISQCLSALATQLLTESETELEALRQRVLRKVGNNVAFLGGMAPEFGLLLGEPPKTHSSFSAEARNRLIQAIRDLVAAVTERGRVLCFFLDDMQWADSDSLSLIEEVVLSARDSPLLLVMAYRDGEVASAHPFLQSVSALRQAGMPIDDLALTPLPESAIEELLCDTFGVGRTRAVDLASLVHSRTAGNPFFVRSFVSALVEDGLLTHTDGSWRWDLESIARRGVTENVVELILGETHRLDADTHRVLELGACMGSRFELQVLKQACPHGVTVDVLWPAIEAGLVLPLGHISGPTDLVGAAPGEYCCFAHDRIQQAIWGEVPGEERKQLHDRLARVLLGRTSASRTPEVLFESVRHLNESGPPENADAVQLRAYLNLEAARQALAAAAAARAAQFAEAGMAHLCGDDWRHRYDLMYGLHWCAAEAAYHTGQFERLEELGALLLEHGRTPLERSRVHHLRAQVCYANNAVADALSLDLKALGELGFLLPENPGQQYVEADARQTRTALAGKSLDDLVGGPECTSATVRQEMEILDRMVLLSYFCASPLFSPLVGRLIRLSVEHGTSPYSAFGYIFYGVAEGAAGNYESAAKFGRIAVAIAERFGNHTILSRTYLHVHYMVAHWTTPFPDAVQPLRRAYSHGASAGSPYDTSVAAASLCIARFLAGEDLRQLEQDSRELAATISQFRQNQVLNWLDPYRQLAMNLSSATEKPWIFHGPAYDERQRVPGPRATGDAAALSNYYYCKALGCLLFCEYEEAYEFVCANRESLVTISSSTLVSAAAFAIDSLARLAVYGSRDDGARLQIVAEVQANQARISDLIPHCPRKYQHNYDLVAAELARVSADHAAAGRLYPLAIRNADGCGVSSERGVVCEAAGRYYYARSAVPQARSALRMAYESYLQWGATTKAQALEIEFPALLPQVLSIGVADPIVQTMKSTTNSSGLLDIIGALQATQLVSREVSLERLLSQLMSLLVKVSGAQSGMLLLAQEASWALRVRQVAPDRQPEAINRIVLAEGVASSAPLVPESILRYAIRTRKTVALEDAGGHPSHSHDRYVRHRHVSSALCVPLLRQGTVVGVIYLENNLAVGLFAAQRTRALELIASQAVVSLENARLYETLEQKVAERTNQLQLKNEELTETLSALESAQERLIVQERLASLGSMTTGLAHELRNPLNFVMNFARAGDKALQRLEGVICTQREATLPSVLGPMKALKQDLSMIRKHGSRIEGLIQSMLSHSNGNTGKRTMVNVNELLASYAELARHGSTAPNLAKVTFETELDETIPALSLIPQEMGRVFLNLVDNAIFATRERGAQLRDEPHTPTVRLRTRNLGSSVEIGVHDNGTGIPEEIRNRIFEPFFTTKGATTGTGLGLSICHEIVTRGNGGTLSVASVLGSHSEFVVALPTQQA